MLVEALEELLSTAATNDGKPSETATMAARYALARAKAGE
jgi:hypothetical protein